jgi:methylated-DNA-protein-cysteine methyltransferase-like protein
MEIRNSKIQSQSKENDFFDRVYQVVRLIPYGRVSSYGAIARYLGSAQSSRMVGWALNACHGVEPFVPAHRVVNRMGILSGKAHFPGSDLMQQLLESEGIQVVDDKITDFDRLFWDPCKELI